MIKPREDNVLVELIKKTSTPGGIILSNTSEEPVAKGRVAVRDKEIDLDTVVLFSAYAGLNLTFEGRDYKILHRKDILATVE